MITQGHMVNGPDFPIKGHVILIKSAIFGLLNGFDGYYQLENAINVDRIVMDVCPVTGGNTGLPTGTPALNNGEYVTIDFVHSGTLQDVGKNGTSYFNGYIRNLYLWYQNQVVFFNPLNTDLATTQLPNQIPAPE
ncbi:MAG: hypothetical protein ACRBB4_01360 [Neptuniibacter sp.]